MGVQGNTGAVENVSMGNSGYEHGSQFFTND